MGWYGSTVSLSTSAPASPRPMRRPRPLMPRVRPRKQAGGACQACWPAPPLTLTLTLTPTLALNLTLALTLALALTFNPHPHPHPNQAGWRRA